MLQGGCANRNIDNENIKNEIESSPKSMNRLFKIWFENVMRTKTHEQVTPKESSKPSKINGNRYSAKIMIWRMDFPRAYPGIPGGGGLAPKGICQRKISCKQITRFGKPEPTDKCSERNTQTNINVKTCKRCARERCARAER